MPRLANTGGASVYDVCRTCAQHLEGAPLPPTLQTQYVNEARGILRDVEVSAWALYGLEADAWACDACDVLLTLDNY